MFEIFDAMSQFLFLVSFVLIFFFFCRNLPSILDGFSDFDRWNWHFLSSENKKSR